MNIAEQLAELLPGVEITDEFVGKLTASIESVVAQRVEEAVEEVNKKATEYGEECQKEIVEIKQKADAYADYVVTEMTQKVDDYADYVVEGFVEENRQRLVETEEYNRMASVLKTIRSAFEDNYFSLSHEPANEKATRELTEARDAYNTLFEQHRVLKRQIAEYDVYVEQHNRKSIFEELTRDLAQTQVEKIAKLLEKATFDSEEAYKSGITLMIEELTAISKEPLPEVVDTTPTAIEEEVTPKEDDDSTSRMKSYLANMSL
jgi:hypothetical protein